MKDIQSINVQEHLKIIISEKKFTGNLETVITKVIMNHRVK
jgi:hypothetical protein